MVADNSKLVISNSAEKCKANNEIKIWALVCYVLLLYKKKFDIEMKFNIVIYFFIMPNEPLFVCHPSSADYYLKTTRQRTKLARFFYIKLVGNIDRSSTKFLFLRLV